MGKKESDSSHSDACEYLWITVLIIFGIIFLLGSLHCCVYNWPVTVSGQLRQCEQGFMCPDYSVRYNEVQYKGNSSLIATLVEGLPRRADTGKTISYNHDDQSVSKSAPFLLTYSLVEGSKLQWEMVSTLNPLNFSVYYERRKGCKKPSDCVTYVEGEDVLTHSGQIQAKVSGKYTISITTNEKQSVQIEKLEVHINYWRYVVEDEEILNKTEPWKFVLPDDLEQTSCVFVELPCNETLPPEKQLIGESYQLKALINKGYLLKFSIFAAILAGLFTVAGLVSLIICCCKDNIDKKPE